MAILVVMLAAVTLPGCSDGAVDPPADAGAVLSREARSATYCARLASDAGTYDIDRALVCRREEGAAAARAGLLDIPPVLDAECGAMAAGGPQLRDFSWQGYMACVDPRLP